MEHVPFYAIKGSPVNESPLGLFDPTEDGPLLEKEYGIPRRYLNRILSPWAVKRLDEYGGDIRKFKIVKRHPSVLKQIGVTKTEPGDENNQDISALVGKVDIRKLETYSQDDPDAYSFSGGLCLANQGLLEFVEMFKAPIKVLHPLLTATQEGNFKGTEGFGAIPFDGIVLAHSNESEWKTFRNNKNNEAFLDRIYIVKVPYCLRVSEEVKIYEKLLRNSSLAEAKCAPGTLKMMSQFAMLTRLKEPENSSLYSKMLIYDGENLKDTDPRAKSYQEYRDYAGVDEGMSGISTRFAFKILSKVFNFDPAEVAANPVHLMYVLEQQIEREQFPAELEQKYLGFIKEHLSARYAEFIGKEIQTAYLESYSEYGQNIFDRYVTYADYWIQDQEYRDTDTGEVFDRGAAQRRAGEDREARGHLEPEGLPQRDRQLRAARAGQQQRQEPGLDELREAAHGDREEDVLEHRGAAAGDQLQRQGERRRGQEARELRQPHGRRRATRPSRCACCASGTCACARAAEPLRSARTATGACSSRSSTAGSPARTSRSATASGSCAATRGRCATRSARRSTSAASATSSRARTSTCPSATSASRRSATAAAARARWSTRATRSTSAATTSSGPRAARGAAAARARPAIRARARTISSST